MIKTLKFLSQIETKIPKKKATEKKKNKAYFSFSTALYFTLVARFGKEDFGRDHKLVYVCNIIDYMLFSALPIQNVAPMGMLKLSIKIYITKKKFLMIL